SLPAVSFEIESGPSSQSRRTIASRVGSPSAANTNAEPPTKPRAASALLRLRGIFVQHLDHDLPASRVRFERLCAPRDRNLVESRFGHGHHHAAFHILQ